MEPIFDRHARHLRRARALRQGDRWLADHMVERTLERFDDFALAPSSLLLLGSEPGLTRGMAARGHSVTVIEAAPARAAETGALCAEEDSLDAFPGRYGAIVSSGGLETVDDLPGVLSLARRALCPGGRFLALMIGGPSLARMREALIAADAAYGRALPRIHPQIDVKTAGDLLMRAGFVGINADIDRLDLSYISLDALAADLRGAAAANVARVRAPGTPGWWAQARRAFLAGDLAGGTGPMGGDGGRVTERISLLTLTALAPE